MHVRMRVWAGAASAYAQDANSQHVGHAAQGRQETECSLTLFCSVCFALSIRFLSPCGARARARALSLFLVVSGCVCVCLCVTPCLGAIAYCHTPFRLSLFFRECSLSLCFAPCHALHIYFSISLVPRLPAPRRLVHLGVQSGKQGRRRRQNVHARAQLLQLCVGLCCQPYGQPQDSTAQGPPCPQAGGPGQVWRRGRSDDGIRF